MQIHEFRIGLTVYTTNPQAESFYGKRGEVVQILAGLQERDGKVVVLFDGIDSPAEFFANDLTTTKPMSLPQARVVMAELQDKVSTLEVETHNQKGHIDLLEHQAVERSNQMDRVKALADDRAVDIERLNVKLKQADNQILRHEESLKTIRASNEVLRGTNESLMFEKAQTAQQLAEMQQDRQRVQTLYNKSIEKRNEMQGTMDTMTQNHEATRAELVRVQDKHDYYQTQSMERGHEIESLKDQAKLRDQILEGWDERCVKDTSIINSLRSQIESLQSINESQKQMIDGHAPAMKKLQGELHKVTHQRDQHKANAAYWKELAIQHGAVAGTPEGEVKRDFLGNPMTMQRRIEIIEAFLGKQFESFN